MAAAGLFECAVDAAWWCHGPGAFAAPWKCSQADQGGWRQACVQHCQEGEGTADLLTVCSCKRGTSSRCSVDPVTMRGRSYPHACTRCRRHASAGCRGNLAPWFIPGKSVQASQLPSAQTGTTPRQRLKPCSNQPTGRAAPPSKPSRLGRCKMPRRPKAWRPQAWLPQRTLCSWLVRHWSSTRRMLLLSQTTSVSCALSLQDNTGKPSNRESITAQPGCGCWGCNQPAACSRGARGHLPMQLACSSAGGVIQQHSLSVQLTG